VPKDHFIIVASPVETAKGILSAYRFWSELTEKQVWYVTPETPHQDRIKGGDQVVFFLENSTGDGGFVAHGLCSGPVAPLTGEDRAFLAELGLTQFTGRIPLLLVIYWLTDVPLAPLVPNLRFIEDKEHYTAYLRQGIVPIEKEDFELIVAQSAPDESRER
jgi:hypothetical protein